MKDTGRDTGSLVGKRLTVREFFSCVFGADVFHDREDGGVYVDFAELDKLYEDYDNDHFKGNTLFWAHKVYEIYEIIIRTLSGGDPAVCHEYNVRRDFPEKWARWEIDPDSAAKFASCHITIDDDAALKWSSDEKYPYYALIGKPLTPEQAALIEKSVNDWKRFDDEPGHNIGAYTIDFYEIFWKADGRIDRMSNTTKYPDTAELIQDGLLFAGLFPFLDMVFALKQEGELDYLIESDFVKDAEIGVYVHDGELEILNAKRARKIYAEYLKKYRRDLHESTTDVAVIGAGAAGMFAAIAAAENGAKVTVIERNEKVGRKLAITGKGRCNVTNDCGADEVMKNLPKNPRFMFSALSEMPPSEIKAFFEREGVPLKTERGNRVFPVSDKAYDIVDALYNKMKKLGVRIVNARATEVTAENGAVTGVVTERGMISAKSVIVATGGMSYPVTGSTGDGYDFARELGHTVTELKPSLVPLETNYPDFPWCGLSLKNVTLTVREEGKKKPIFREMGEMLFTHFGISGPLVLSAGSVMGEITPGKYTAYIDFKPALDEQTLDKRIMRDFDEMKNTHLANAMKKLLPQSAILAVLGEARVEPGKQCNSVTREERAALVRTLKAYPLEITGYRPIDEAIITDGGVSVKEVDPKTMRSKLVDGLYFAGEILDVTGFTGGFNLTVAFASGYAAGRAAATSCMY